MQVVLQARRKQGLREVQQCHQRLTDVQRQLASQQVPLLYASSTCMHSKPSAAAVAPCDSAVDLNTDWLHARMQIQSEHSLVICIRCRSPACVVIKYGSYPDMESAVRGLRQYRTMALSEP